MKKTICELIVYNAGSAMRICEPIIGLSWIYMNKLRESKSDVGVMTASFQFRIKLPEIRNRLGALAVTNEKIYELLDQLDKIAESALRGETKKETVIRKTELIVKELCKEVLDYFVKKPCLETLG